MPAANVRSVAALAALAIFLGSEQARSHAFLEHATPAVGSTARDPPTQVSLSFSEELEAAFSTIEVVDNAGRRVDRQDGAVDPQQPTVLRASLGPLAPGTYTVNWRVVSVDTHPTQGHFTFRVGT